MLAYQLAFELSESELQGFLKAVVKIVCPTNEGPEGGNASDSDSVVSNWKKLSVFSSLIRQFKERKVVLREILEGTRTIGINLEFLCRNNKSDPIIIKSTRFSVKKKMMFVHVHM